MSPTNRCNSKEAENERCVMREYKCLKVTHYPAEPREDGTRERRFWPRDVVLTGRSDATNYCRSRDGTRLVFFTGDEEIPAAFLTREWSWYRRPDPLAVSVVGRDDWALH